MHQIRIMDEKYVLSPSPPKSSMLKLYPAFKTIGEAVYARKITAAYRSYGLYKVIYEVTDIDGEVPF